ncbi:hypothetical protein FB1_23920 [Flavobacterium branchiophilum NBRC 15030 = ATCC 35035]|nr:hypothetical protein FB1_23920 [Flavobacterium branchiophilum NBRC 15030 = ATCC 35035]
MQKFDDFINIVIKLYTQSVFNICGSCHIVIFFIIITFQAANIKKLSYIRIMRQQLSEKKYEINKFLIQYMVDFSFINQSRLVKP